MLSPLARLPTRLLCKVGAAPRLLRPTRGAPVILMYHGVTREMGPGLVNHNGKHVHADLFRRHLQMLSRHRRVVPLGVLIEALRKGEDAEGMVAITFDDGYLDNVECAAPLLAELKLPATFFLTTGFIGEARWAWVDRVEALLHAAADGVFDISVLGTRERLNGIPERVELLRRIKAVLKTVPWEEAEARVAELESDLRVGPQEPWGVYRFMGWGEVRKLVDAGFEVGAHTVNHAILSRVGVADAEREITASRERIVTEVGSCSPTFCYPNGKRGDYTGDVVAICRQRFTAALSTELGAARRDELYELRRVPVDAATIEERLASMVVQAE
jgi:peptidoglycan/xylan/chitin deacetylase (PgdA/CDA1 family)